MIKTQIIKFEFNVLMKRHEWEKLKRQMSDIGVKVFKGSPEGLYPSIFSGKEAVLETEFLFDNQWNASVDGAKGFRLFDFYVVVDGPRRTGYYLKQTPEMMQVRENRYVCGYCGKQHETVAGVHLLTAVGGGHNALYIEDDWFCASCSGSEHVDAKAMKLMRLKNVMAKGSREEISKEQLALLSEICSKAYNRKLTQFGPESEEAKKLADEYRERLQVMSWFAARSMAHNTAYRTDKGWRFGWLTPVPDHAEEELHRMLKYFPYKYTVRLTNDRERNDPRQK